MTHIVAPRERWLRPNRLNLANLVTGTRAILVLLTLVVVLMAFMAPGPMEPVRTWTLFALALPAWALDLLDGHLARRADRVTRFGGHFDEETDALLMLVLAVALAPLAPWALAIGLAHYAFLLLRLTSPVWRAGLAPRASRKVMAATAGGILVWSVLPWIPAWLAQLALVVGVGVTAYSFGRDLWAMARSRPQR